MSAIVLDGKKLADEIRLEIARDVAEFSRRTGVKPTLAAVLVGDDPASHVYVRNKQKACDSNGLGSILHRLPVTTTTGELLALIAQLNANQAVHGILVQLPLPHGIDSTRVLDTVTPLKDVDAFHPENVGLIVQSRPRFLPCTPHGIQQLLIRRQIVTAGAHVVVLGRSDIVGKPIAIMLAQKGPHADATVTICHSRSRDLPAIARTADILIAAIGRPKFVSDNMVKPGATVIDVGINRTDAGLVGDVDFEAVSQVAGAITPVPGGIGPLTITMLLNNTLMAARMQLKELGARS
jgi:methylenetetrahydrofolate dehydrogenase (NADP+)/methenyltetrahydrofolate cyclohydrolase